jgi:hypothetical protein
MNIANTSRYEATPSLWVINSNDGVTVNATNSKTNRNFTGTMAAFLTALSDAQAFYDNDLEFQATVTPKYITPGTPIVIKMAREPVIAYVVLYPASGDTLTLEQSRNGGLSWSTVLTATAQDTGQRFDGGCPLVRISGANAASYFTVC